MAKTKKTKLTQKEILKYNVCEHHRVGYAQLEKLCNKQLKDLKRQDRVIERLSKDVERKGAWVKELEDSKELWITNVNQNLLKKVENSNKQLQDQKEYYEKKIKFLEDQYDKAIEHNRQMLEVNNRNLEVNKELTEANKELQKNHNEITRAYNGLHHMGKFAQELGIDITKHNKQLPEYDQYEGFEQKHTLLESGKVRHTYSMKKKKSKEGDSDE